ncbi:DUF2785 domain-containing protein, partial [Stenotrophomonas maltophilia]|nr:DUF2785 domain-containing protein [Stenotrophomonas maltophilia]
KDLLPHQEIADWINGLAQCVGWLRSRGQMIARVNSKNFLRSLYFKRGRNRGNGLATAMLAAEAQLNRFAIRE